VPAAERIEKRGSDPVAFQHGAERMRVAEEVKTSAPGRSGRVRRSTFSPPRRLSSSQ